MNVVDSSAWLEYFADGPNASAFEPAITNISDLIVPSVVVFEVFKRIQAQSDTESALFAIAQVKRGKSVPLDDDLAIAAAALSVEQKLPFADSVILATARLLDATLWTQDSDFEGLPNVEYRQKS